MGVQKESKTAKAVSKTEIIVSPKAIVDAMGETKKRKKNPDSSPKTKGETAGGNTPEVSESMKILTTAIRIRKDKVRKDGLSPIYLKVTHHRIVKKLDLQMHWEADKFDPHAQKCKPRFPRDQEANDRNLELGQIKARINDIRTAFRLSNRDLTMEKFIKEFENYDSRDCFTTYATNKNLELKDKEIISKRSYQANRLGINNLKKYHNYAPLPFASLSVDFIRAFDAWLRNNRKYKHNTITGIHKAIKTYLNHADRESHKFTNPYKDKSLSFKFREGERAVLEKEDVIALKNLLGSDELSVMQNEVLRKFLFSCYTGLRISDSKNLHRNMIDNGVLTIAMKKGLKYGKTVAIPLPDYALQLIKGRNELLFEPMADKTCNVELKVIAAKAGIHKKLTFHVSRDTFGTYLAENGADISTIRELMGHSSFSTTQIYIKISQKRKEKVMQLFNNLF